MTKRTRRTLIVVGVLVGAVVVLNLLAQGLDRAVGGNEPGGVAGSSYSTGPDGVAAYASLLRHYGHEVTAARGDLVDVRLPDDATAVVLEPSVLTANDATTLLEFVTDGGRLVIGGRAPFYLGTLRDRPPKWDPAGQSPWTEVAPVLGGVHLIDTAAVGSWTSPGSGQVLVGNDDRSLLTSDRVGRGEMLFLADPSAVENAQLGSADNASFALALAGSTDRPVVFVEGVHGFGESRGFSAIPTRWKIGLLLLALAVIAFVWSRARRFGPPDRPARDLPPARAEYVRALSITLERTHDPAHALAPLQGWARDRLTARAALPADASDDELTRAARSLGFDDAEIQAVLAPPATNQDALALGRVVAHVESRDGRMM